jgi:DnaJ-class molecular chaperone
VPASRNAPTTRSRCRSDTRHGPKEKTLEKADHYRVLGVSRGAAPEDIKSAYRREALRWHPDRNPGVGEAEERFKAASAAYEVLRDPEKRRAYDMELAGFGRDAVPVGYGRGGGRGRGCGGGRGGRCAGGFGRGRGWRARAGFGDQGSLVLNVSLGSLEAVLGCRRRIAVESVSGRQVLDIRLPPGLADGDIVRLEGLGKEVRLRVNIASVV